ncbi:TMEM175 family protein [Atopobacter phocae]|uniref:TMEM175 family protein n=1 Tax=Atopobacter phocae TaxID=136492 RepID=UPI0004714A57|nr:TMEM175 family protein [Atopobacter phocae]
MKSGRMEAFSDGVLAIIITIMVLELRPPFEVDRESLHHLLGSFVSYALSFMYVGIYWNNHHHLLQMLEFVNGKVLWLNLHWLFWMSLIPFSTAWIGMNPYEKLPTTIYGVVLLLCAISYVLLQHVVMKYQTKSTKLKEYFGTDWKGRISLVIYILGIALSFYHPALADITYLIVALLWFIPDKRIEKSLFYYEE